MYCIYTLIYPHVLYLYPHVLYLYPHVLYIIIPSYNLMYCIYTLMCVLCIVTVSCKPSFTIIDILLKMLKQERLRVAE